MKFNKIDILKGDIERLKAENEELKEQLDIIPKYEKLYATTLVAKQEYDKLITQLKEEREKYRELNKEFEKMKVDYEKRAQKMIKEQKKIIK